MQAESRTEPSPQVHHHPGVSWAKWLKSLQTENDKPHTGAIEPKDEKNMTELMRAAGANTMQQFVLSILMTLGVFVLMASYGLGVVKATPFMDSIALLVVREWIATLSFWYSSSHGSKQKDLPRPQQ